MSKKTQNENKNYFASYSFKRSIIPLIEEKKDKVKPPDLVDDSKENEVKENNLISKKELTLEEQAQQYMDAYRKAERIVVINFYTGGGPYKKGVLDAMYRGFNPLNP